MSGRFDRRGDWFRGLSLRQEFDCGRSVFACFLRRVAGGERCERGGPGWHRPEWGHRTRQSTPIFERVVSHVTITDPHHFLFGHRLEVLKERSGRGPAYVVVALPDGRRRAVRIASTDLAETPISSHPNAADLPRISARTLIPLMQHLSASLSLLDEKVIRDDPPTTSRSRCVSGASTISRWASRLLTGSVRGLINRSRLSAEGPDTAHRLLTMSRNRCP